MADKDNFVVKFENRSYLTLGLASTILLLLPYSVLGETAKTTSTTSHNPYDITVFFSQPIFGIVWAAIGGGAGYLLKIVVDYWMNRVQQQQEFAKHVKDQIEKMAPSYFRMSNYAKRLSSNLSRFVEIKRQLQLVHYESPSSIPYSSPAYDMLEKQALKIGRSALYDAALLYRVIEDRFYVSGGDYFLPDKWAKRAIGNLHNELLDVVPFDKDIILKYVKDDTQESEFYGQLDGVADNLTELQETYEQYRSWLIKEDETVKRAAAYARAYSDLFSEQMESLYKDWFERGMMRKLRKFSDDPKEAHEVRKPSSRLSPETRRLIVEAAQRDELEKKERSRLILEEINAEQQLKLSNAFLNLGWNYYIAGQYDLAIVEYNKAREIGSENSVIYNNLGNAFASKAESDKDYEEASHMYDKALALSDSKNAVFHANYGWMWEKKARERYLSADESLICYEKANQCYLKAITLDFSNSYYHNDLGVVFYEWEKWDEATQAFSHAIALAPFEPLLYDNLADAYNKKGDYELALAACRKAINLDPKSSKHYYRMLEIAEKLELWRDAIDTCKEIINLQPENNSTDYYRLGQISEHLGLWQDAIDAYSKALDKDDKNSEFALKLLNAYEKSENIIRLEIYDKLIHACQKAIQMYPDNDLDHYRLAKIYFSKGDFERALYECDNAVHLKPTNGHYYNQLGLTYRRLQRWDMALSCYRKALSLFGKDIPTDLLHNIGLVLQYLGLFDEALPFLESTIKNWPDDLEALLSLATVYMSGSNRNLTEAAKLCQRAIRSKSEHPSSYLVYGDLLFLENKYSQSAGEYEKAYALDPRLKNILTNLISVYQLLTQAEPDNPEHYFYLAYTFERAENFHWEATDYQRLQLDLHEMAYYKAAYYDVAVQLWEYAILVQPQSLTFAIRNNLARAYAGLRKVKESIHNYRDCTLLEPNNFEVRYNLGSIYYNDESYLVALGEFQEASRLKPLYAQPYYMIGNCYYRIQVTDLAEDRWLYATTLNPPSARAFYNLGVLSYQRDDKDAASHYWKQAISYRAELTEAHYNLGIVEFEKGNDEESMNFWNKALEVNDQFGPAKQLINAIMKKHDIFIHLKICDIIDVYQLEN